MVSRHITRFVAMLLGLGACLALVTLSAVGCAKPVAKGPVRAGVEIVDETPTPTPKPTQKPRGLGRGDQEGVDTMIETMADGSTREIGLYPIYFDYDSSELTEDQKKTIELVAAYLKHKKGLRVMVEGNTDERGPSSYNLALGERRALNVKDYIIFLGISASRLEVISYGEERPVDHAGGESSWAKNRRVFFSKLNSADGE